jgi:hypothetical protein
MTLKTPCCRCGYEHLVNRRDSQDATHSCSIVFFRKVGDVLTIRNYSMHYEQRCCTIFCITTLNRGGEVEWSKLQLEHKYQAKRR